MLYLLKTLQSTLAGIAEDTVDRQTNKTILARLSEGLCGFQGMKLW